MLGSVQPSSLMDILPMPILGIGKELLDLIPRDISKAVRSLDKHFSSDVLGPLLRSQSVQELGLQVETLLDSYDQYLKVRSDLLRYAFRERYEQHVRNSSMSLLGEYRRIIESKAPGKLTETAILNALAGIDSLQRSIRAVSHIITHGFWNSAVPVERDTEDVLRTLLIAGLYLNCILYYLTESVKIVVEDEVVDEIAYQGRVNARSLYAEILGWDLLEKPERRVPDDIETDEEDMWLAEAGLEDYLKHLD